jgi:hypothetical protein
MSESEPTLTRTYCTAIARRASLERVQCGLLGISAHTPMRIRRCWAVPTRLPLAGETGTWQGKMSYSRDRSSAGRPASRRPGFESPPWGLDPGKRAPECRLGTISPCVRAWRLRQALVHEISYHYFGAVSLGQEIPASGTQAGAGGIRRGDLGSPPRASMWRWSSRCPTSTGSSSRTRTLVQPVPIEYTAVTAVMPSAPARL